MNSTEALHARSATLRIVSSPISRHHPDLKLEGLSAPDWLVCCSNMKNPPGALAAKGPVTLPGMEMRCRQKAEIAASTRTMRWKPAPDKGKYANLKSVGVEKSFIATCYTFV